MKYSHSKAMAVFYKIIKLVKNGVLMIIHIYAKVSPSLKLIKAILISMGIILILGFFIDFVEISLIIVPIFYPIALSLGIDMQWFAILIAMNLQTSFLTPPFGFSLFYLKGVAPKSSVLVNKLLETFA
jgi:TRAP-type mannitol/chloroaromatic compound transport system permease large subunit